MEDLRYNDFREQEKQSEWDLNTPGLLVHGIRNPHVALKGILRNGLKAQDHQGFLMRYRRAYRSPNSDVVSLSIVSALGYNATSAAKIYGAYDDSSEYRLTAVLDPKYVELHNSDFRAVGSFLNPNRDEPVPTFDCVRDIFKYKQVSDAKVFPDEIQVKSVPFDSIAALVVSVAHAPQAREELKTLGSTITLIDTNGMHYM